MPKSYAIIKPQYQHIHSNQIKPHNYIRDGRIEFCGHYRTKSKPIQIINPHYHKWPRIESCGLFKLYKKPCFTIYTQDIQRNLISYTVFIRPITNYIHCNHDLDPILKTLSTFQPTPTFSNTGFYTHGIF